MEVVAAIRADVAVTGEELVVGQARLQIKRVDVGHALGADDAVDRDDGLLSCDGIGAAMKHRHLAARFPAHLVGRVVKDRLLQRYPRLR